ncbi:MAG: hypothetical protein CVU60_17230 [Deltaproteobacteria bacterium HGW-Deltaproteobacteria-18]|nr:MAG: hypothetical protein CVU60_17230 [Deltaproteobacteria bacterium HGW-Deltaproteobacteria-18]
MKHLDAILQALGGHRTANNGIMVHCCAHDDPNPSLSITSRGGKLLAKCFAGCDQATVIASLKARGLWPESTPKQDAPDGIPATWRGKPLAGRWTYRAEDNAVLGYVARYDGPDGKDIIPFFKRDGQRWISGAAQTPRPLYGLDELPGFTGGIVIVEGEKAADAAQRLLADAVAITWPGGSNAVKKADWAQMRGRNVVVWPDNDEPGLKAARDVEAMCREAGATSVRILTPPAGKPKGWDAADAVAEGWSKETFTAWLEAPEQSETSKQLDPYLRGIFTAAALLAMVLPELVWAVQGLLAMGLAILAGGPKLGKSWLVTLICLGVGRGGLVLGHFTAERGKVLYLALEDSKRRLQDRIRTLCQLEPELTDGLENVDFQTSWPRVDEGGLEKLESYIRENVPKGLKLVVLDTLAKIGPKSKPKGLNAYEADSLAMGQIKAIADKYSICILVVTHMSKGRSSNRDPFEAITGSSGQFGTADTAMLLTRSREAETAKLLTTGRDIDGEAYALRWTHPGWICTGLDHGATAPKISPERQAILKTFASHHGPLSPNMVAHTLRKSPKTISKLINSLSEDGLLFCVGYGLYSLPGGQGGGSSGSDRDGGCGGNGISAGDIMGGGSSNLSETRDEEVTSTTSTTSSVASKKLVEVEL